MKLLGRGADDSGMTLPEILVAAAILLVCLTSLATLLAGAVSSSLAAKMRDEAANLANARIEAARSLPYDQVGVRYSNGVSGDPAGSILTPDVNGKFTVETLCSWVRTADGRAAYKKLTIHVTWANPVPGTLDVTTMIYGRSSLVTAGDLVVKLRYREDGSPVQSASVAIRASDGSARAVMSDTAGEAFFGQVPVGAVGLAVTPPAGYVVDGSALASAAVTPDALSTVIVYVQKPATTVVHVHSSTGSPIVGATVSLHRQDGTDLPAVTTDENGNAVFASLLYASYSATVSKSGYTSATLPFTLTNGTTAPTVDFTMSPVSFANLLVRVFDANGTQLPGAAVSITTTAGAVVGSGTSGSNGECPFNSLAAGSYRVLVSKSSFMSQNTPVAIGSSGSVTLDVQLGAVANGAMHVTTLLLNNGGNNAQPASLRFVVSGPSYYNDALVSDSSGSLTLSNLVPGSYSVRTYTLPSSTVTVLISSSSIADVSISQKAK